MESLSLDGLTLDELIKRAKKHIVSRRFRGLTEEDKELIALIREFDPTYDALGRRLIGASDALALLSSVEYEPLEEYPGTASAKWRMRHKPCGTEKTRPLSSLARAIKRDIGVCHVCAFCPAALSTRRDQQTKRNLYSLFSEGITGARAAKAAGCSPALVAYHYKRWQVSDY